MRAQAADVAFPFRWLFTFFLLLGSDTDAGANRQPPHHRNEHGEGQVPNATSSLRARNDDSPEKHKHSKARHLLNPVHPIAKYGREIERERISRLRFRFIIQHNRNLPSKMPPGSRQGTRVVLEDKTTRSKGIGLEIRGPVDGAHVKVKDAAIFRRHLLQQVDGVLADESPLVCSKIVEARHGTVSLIVQANLEQAQLFQC